MVNVLIFIISVKIGKIFIILSIIKVNKKEQFFYALIILNLSNSFLSVLSTHLVYPFLYYRHSD